MHSYDVFFCAVVSVIRVGIVAMECSVKRQVVYVYSLVKYRLIEANETWVFEGQAVRQMLRVLEAKERGK